MTTTRLPERTPPISVWSDWDRTELEMGQLIVPFRLTNRPRSIYMLQHALICSHMFFHTPILLSSLSYAPIYPLQHDRVLFYVGTLADHDAGAAEILHGLQKVPVVHIGIIEIQVPALPLVAVLYP